MKKLINGIVEFRRNILPGYREKFAQLALEQRPDVLFIACSDSRVVPNLFASTDPGDLFVIRNVGNLIPPCGLDGASVADESEAAAVEFAVLLLSVQDIVVCGHSECGAMQAIATGRAPSNAPHLASWLRHGSEAKARLDKLPREKWRLAEHNELSQLNVLLQIEHLMSYPVIAEAVKTRKLRLHGWWFDIKHANVYAYESDQSKFVLIDDQQAQRVLERLK